MTKTRTSLIVVSWSLLTPASAQLTTRASVSSTGAQASGASDRPALSRDGTTLLFSSTGSNLVAGDSNGAYDVFVRDLATSQTARVSVDSSGAQGNGDSRVPSLSADGRFVAFESDASNLVGGDTNFSRDIFVHDRVLGLTERVNVSSAGAPSNFNASFRPLLSDDGRYVVFSSGSTNLVVNDTNNRHDVFVRDRQLATTVCVSWAPGGVPSDRDSSSPSISGDGRLVAFKSFATNLIAGDANGRFDVFVHDLQTGLTKLASASSTGVQGNGDSTEPRISGDGRYVVFESTSDNLAPLPPILGGEPCLHIRDLQTEQTFAVSSGRSPAISTDGRFVSFSSARNDLVSGDISWNVPDVFLHDRVNGTTSLLPHSACGVQGMPHQYFVSISSISGDGALVAFDSTASNLVDLDTNNATDVFLYDPSGLPSGGPSCTYCVAGLTTHGCTPAISGSGVPSASAGSGFSVAVNQVEGQRLGIFFMGEGPSFAPFSSGSTSYRCVAGPFRRLPPQSTGGTNGACDGALSIDWNTTCGSFYLAGAAVFVQLYFRDPPAVNLSNALQFIVQP